MDDNQIERRMRLKELMNTLNVNNISFATALKTNKGFISQLLNGHREITPAFAYKISKRYSLVNPIWLLSGDGNMFIDADIENKYLEAGTLDPQVMEQEEGYAAKKEGVLESLVRRVAALEREEYTVVQVSPSGATTAPRGSVAGYTRRRVLQPEGFAGHISAG